jgi:hypothetical protein
MADLTAQDRMALARIEVLTDPQKLRTLIENAHRLGNAAVERAAFLRLCHVQPEATPGTVEHDVWQSVHALEEMLRAERGKTTRLSRTRQKIARDGEAKTVSDLTLKPDASQGFADLIDRRHPELTFEAVVLRHPLTFPPHVTAAARTRLADAGLDPDTFTQSPIGA